MDTQDRIAQWEKMTREAPDAMAWFSLGNAYREAERYDEAVEAFRQAIAMDEGMSRAYQLLGQILIKLGRESEAGPLLQKGFEVAASRGDVMPQRAIGSLLEKLGLPVPEIRRAAPETPITGENTIIDRRTGRPQARLPDPPMRGPVGKFIYDHFGADTWHEWIRTGTKVINELRLDFSNPEHQKLYEQQMLEWLGVSDEEVAEYAAQAQK